MEADKVLVVEDDPDVRAALTRALSFEGYDVAIAEDGGPRARSGSFTIHRA